MVDMESGEVLLHGKLHEDNYVIVSLSKSLTKIDFNFQDKFIFVPRLEGVSGTIIREAVVSGELDSAKQLLPPETIKVLKKEVKLDRAPLHQVRDVKGILYTANQATVPDLKSLSIIDERTLESILEFRDVLPVVSVATIPRGFYHHWRPGSIEIPCGDILKITLRLYVS
jgi:predicted nucleotidyltransferase